jgi:hypothetical protein
VTAVEGPIQGICNDSACGFPSQRSLRLGTHDRESVTAVGVFESTRTLRGGWWRLRGGWRRLKGGGGEGGGQGTCGRMTGVQVVRPFLASASRNAAPFRTPRFPSRAVSDAWHATRRRSGYRAARRACRPAPLDSEVLGMFALRECCV